MSSGGDGIIPCLLLSRSFNAQAHHQRRGNRIKYLDAMLAYMKKHKDVVFWQGDQIHEWYAKEVGAKA